ncbi:hypothetical protein K1719_045478 [Acacia pycnantha]|nr:hypothetical protein K1719_045478 [Acacia pycnantha]
MERILQKAWNLQSGFDVIEVTGNAFMFKFADIEEYNRILCGRLWSINGNILNLMERSKYKTCEEFEFSRCPIWIQIHNIPMEAMCVENAIMIGGYVGNVMLAEDPYYRDRYLHNFLRVRIVLDLRKALVSGFWIPKPDGSRFWVSILYEKLQRFCYICGRIGHDNRSCKTEKLMSVVNNDELQFGPWTVTSQCRSWEEMLLKEEGSKVEEEDIFTIKVHKSSASVKKEVLGQQREGGGSSLADGLLPNISLLERSHRQSHKIKPRDVSGYAYVEGNMVGCPHVDTEVESDRGSEFVQSPDDKDPAYKLGNSLSERIMNPLSIVPYKALSDVISGICGLGLKRMATEELEFTTLKRRKLIATDSNLPDPSISNFAGNLKKVKDKLRKVVKRKTGVEEGEYSRGGSFLGRTNGGHSGISTSGS